MFFVCGSFFAAFGFSFAGIVIAIDIRDLKRACGLDLDNSITFGGHVMGMVGRQRDEIAGIQRMFLGRPRISC